MQRACKTGGRRDGRRRVWVALVGAASWAVQAQGGGGAVAYPVAPQGTWDSVASAGAVSRTVPVTPGALAVLAPAARSVPGATALADSGPAGGEFGGYRLAPGDRVRITVYQNPDLTVETRLNDAGTLSYPLVGVVPLGGLDVGAAERRVADALRLGQFVRQPQVSITLLEARGHQASVLGQVNRPGRYAIEVASLRLSELLALAGGTSPGGADRIVVSGWRDSRPYRAEVDLPSLFGAEGRQLDLLIRHGDTVWVDRQPQLYIYGAVQRPGALRLERGMTLLQALATGGGLTARGTDKGIRIHRRGTDGAMTVLRPSLHEPVQEGDVVHVAESLF